MDYLVLIGRILFAAIFVMSGIAHFARMDAMAGMVRQAGLPSPRFWVGATGAMILLGGLSILLGVYPQVGAGLLVLFLVPTAVIMHRFWGVSDPMMAANQMAHFNKNLALAGAALLIVYFGTGPFSLAP